MAKKSAGMILALLMGVTTTSGAGDDASLLKGPYLGQEPPGITAEPFAPWLFKKGESVGCSGFLTDGTVFVFSSMKRGTDWRFKSTYVMKLVDGEWTEPEAAPFSAYMPYNFTVGPGAGPSTSPP